MAKPKRISVRIPTVLYNRIKQDAKRQGISMAEHGRLAMSWYLAISRTKQHP